MTNNNENYTPSVSAGTPHRRRPDSEHYGRPVQIRLPGKDFSIHTGTTSPAAVRQPVHAIQGDA